MPTQLSGQEQAGTRATLLHFNAGTWEGSFVRLDRGGREVERFGSHLEVADRHGTIHADLTNRNSGTVRSMHFVDPPAEMQITPQGHWSLGPDRIGPWPWVCELCLVWGERRRRIIVRHNTDGLESLVLVTEGRPGHEPDPPATPLQGMAHALGGDRLRWDFDQAAGTSVTTMARRVSGQEERVGLAWQPERGVMLQIERRYSPYGQLLGFDA